MPTYGFECGGLKFVILTPTFMFAEDQRRVRRMIKRRIERGEAKGHFIFTNTYDGERYKIQWWPYSEKPPKKISKGA